MTTYTQTLDCAEDLQTAEKYRGWMIERGDATENAWIEMDGTGQFYRILDQVEVGA